MKKHQQQLEQAWESYQKTVLAVATQAFTDVVKPYCQKHNLRFMAGNGDFFIGPDAPLQNWKHDPDHQFPKRVAQVLDLEVPGMPGNDLGSLMPPFPDTC